MHKAIIRPILCAVLVFCVAFGFHVRSAATTSLIVDDDSSGANTMFPTTGFQSTLSNQNQYNGTSSFQTPTPIPVISAFHNRSDSAVLSI